MLEDISKMVVLISEKLGSVYTLDPDTFTELYYQPLNKDNSYSSNFNDFNVVDWLSISGEDANIGKELNRIHTLLKGELKCH